MIRISTTPPGEAISAAACLTEALAWATVPEWSAAPPYDTEDALWDDLRDLLVLRIAVTDALNDSHARLGAPPVGARTRRAHEEFCALQEVLHGRISSALGRVESRVRDRWLATPSSPNAPRLIRLAHRLGLTEEQVLIVAYGVAAHCEPRIGYAEGRSRDLAITVTEIMRSLGVSSNSLLSLSEQDAPLRTAGVIEAEEGASWRPFRQMVVPLMVARFLRGHRLLDEALTALPAGPLRQLAEEEGWTPLPDRRPARPVEVVAEDDGPPLADLLRELSIAHAAQAGPMSDHGEAFASITDYLDAHLELFMARARLQEGRSERNSARPSFRLGNDDAIASLTTLVGRVHALEARVARRLEASLAAGRSPAPELLFDRFALDRFERNVLLISAMVQNFSSIREGLLGRFNLFRAGLTVRWFLEFLSDSLEDQIRNRVRFNRTGRLARSGLVRFQGTDPLPEIELVLSAPLSSFLVGGTDPAETVDTAQLSSPTESLDQVILPDGDRAKIEKALAGFVARQGLWRTLGYRKLVRYGNQTAMVFQGPPGTGKTLLARAVMAKLGLRMLELSGLSLSVGGLQAALQAAELDPSVGVFIDEAEAVIEDRDRSPATSETLVALEQFNGLIILATNRPGIRLDDAIGRRLDLQVDFQLPDESLRTRLWTLYLTPGGQLAAELPLAEDVVPAALAREVPGLTGAAIVKAVRRAVSEMGGESEGTMVISQQALLRAAREELAHQLRTSAGAEVEIPTVGLDKLVLGRVTSAQLDDIMEYDRVSPIVRGDWQIGAAENDKRGTFAIFHGPPGTGKSCAARAVAYHLGRPLLTADLAQVTDKYVGETEKHLARRFEAAERAGAVLVINDVEALAAERTAVERSGDRHANGIVNYLLTALERYRGIVILTTNDIAAIDRAIQRRAPFKVGFSLPTTQERVTILDKALGTRMARGATLDLHTLAERFSLSPALLVGAVDRAASRVAAREGRAGVIQPEDLEDALSQVAGPRAATHVNGFARS